MSGRDHTFHGDYGLSCADTSANPLVAMPMGNHNNRLSTFITCLTLASQIIESFCLSMYSDLIHLGGADKYVDEVLEIINSIKLLDDFSADEVRYLCAYMQCYAAPRDYSLLVEGTGGDYLLLILSGGVDVYKNDASAEGRHMVARLGIGDTIGEMSLIDGYPRSASCITTHPTDFAVFSRSSMQELLVNMPKLGNKILIKLLQLMTERLRDTSNRYPDGAFFSLV